MNRALVIPAVGCALACTGLFALLHRAAAEGEAPRDSAPQATAAAAPADVGATLAALAAEYVRPWRRYQQAAASTFSRVTPRSVPSITTAVEIAAGDPALPVPLVLATIHVTIIGVSTTSTPCIIDPETKEMRLFVAGRWQQPDDWLKTAPHPRAFKAPGEQADPRQPLAPAAEPAP